MINFILSVIFIPLLISIYFYTVSKKDEIKYNAKEMLKNYRKCISVFSDIKREMYKTEIVDKIDNNYYYTSNIHEIYWSSNAKNMLKNFNESLEMVRLNDQYPYNKRYNKFKKMMIENLLEIYLYLHYDNYFILIKENLIPYRREDGYCIFKDIEFAIKHNEIKHNEKTYTRCIDIQFTDGNVYLEDGSDSVILLNKNEYNNFLFFKEKYKNIEMDQYIENNISSCYDDFAYLFFSECRYVLSPLVDLMKFIMNFLKKYNPLLISISLNLDYIPKIKIIKSKKWIRISIKMNKK